MLQMLDRGGAGILVLLDLSAAFDLLDHGLLLEALNSRAECSDHSTTWFNSFLSGRRSRVCWGEGTSEPEDIWCGVPQGSCLSPTLFNIYMVPLFRLLDRHGICFTNYADDTQLLLELTRNHRADSALLKETYDTVKEWMDDSWMCLNANKTELVLIARKNDPIHSDPAYSTFMIEESPIPVLAKSKTLGTTVDSELSMKDYADQVMRSSQYPVRLLRSAGPFLSADSRATIARALVLSKLDYCNSLLGGANVSVINRMQVVQNNAVRAVTGTPRWLPISEHRKALHWLPVAKRIDFKILCITYNCFHNRAPEYLRNYCTRYFPTRDLRASDCLRLRQPEFRLRKTGGRAFPARAASAWNALPLSIKTAPSLATFKKLLKTYLFSLN